jgi:hypothetical protein
MNQSNSQIKPPNFNVENHVNPQITNKKMEINLKMKIWILEYFYKIMAMVMGYEFVTCGNLDFGAFVAPSLGL